MQSTTLIASLSVDLDNQWSYMKTHGDPGWEFYPTYLDMVVPRILSLLEELDLRITFFVVGRDASLSRNRGALASIASAGHEIGNHSYNHNPWLHLYTERDFDYELQLAEDAIAMATGQKTIGFRGPGYSSSASTMQVLRRRDYMYDSSTLPTFIGPLARTYYFRHSNLGDDDREKRATLFGSFRDGFRPLRPYRWPSGNDIDEQGLIEIPVTTLPLLKIPFHISYILYIASYSCGLARMYFKSALWMCRLAGIQPSLLLHPLDFLGHEDMSELDFFPGMQLSRSFKLELVQGLLASYSRHFDVIPLSQHAVEFVKEASIALAGPGLG